MHYLHYNNNQGEIYESSGLEQRCLSFLRSSKKLAQVKGIEYEERNISRDWTREQLLEAVPDARTVPQIFLDEQLIGGFTELRKHFKG